METKKRLDWFGCLSMQDCRDVVLKNFHKTLAGKMKSPDSVTLYEKTKDLPEDILQLLQAFVYDSVDSIMHHFLWMIEEQESLDLITYEDDDKKHFLSLKDLSDGLCGELYTDEGWIAKYSAYPPSIK